MFLERMEKFQRLKLVFNAQTGRKDRYRAYLRQFFRLDLAFRNPHRAQALMKPDSASVDVLPHLAV